MGVKLTLIKTAGYVFLKIKNIFCGCIQQYNKSRFKACGDNVRINAGGIFTYETISIGSDVFIGANAIMQSRHGEIIIGNHVAFGPCVHIFGGNHEIHEVGKYMKNLSSQNDGQVVIEDDCWIASNVTILRGVRIGKGSVIGAGAIVSKDIPPYSIYTGVPEVKIRKRFTNDQIEQHEKLLKENERDAIC